MKPIDWPRILANPDAYSTHFDRLDERIKKWDALADLCKVTDNPLESFDRQLMLIARDFLKMVRKREWDTAEGLYEEIMAARKQVADRLGVPIKINHKPQPA